MAVAHSIQDRTSEFRSIITLQRKQLKTAKAGAQRSLLTESQQQDATAAGPPKRSEFARRAAEIGRGIGGTMEKLQKLAELAKRKTLFDDRPVEINELTFIIKQDLAQLNSSISNLQTLSRQIHPQGKSKIDQVGEHNKNVVVLLQHNLKNVTTDFRDVLETRSANIQASKVRSEAFVSQVGAQTALGPAHSDSPLYNTPLRGSPAPPSSDILNLNPVGDQQLLLMEEGVQDGNAYINQRGQAIESIERTIAELGGIFGQLAGMVSEQSEMIQRIDANTEDVVDNVEGAQRELLKYWSRVSGNRWLVAKMFGVLMIFFLLWVLVAG